MTSIPGSTFRLSRDDKKQLKELARRLNTTRSQAVRLCIRAALSALQEHEKKLQTNEGINAKK